MNANGHRPSVPWPGQPCDACTDGKHEACTGGWDFCGCASPICLLRPQEDR